MQALEKTLKSLTFDDVIALSRDDMQAVDEPHIDEPAQRRRTGLPGLGIHCHERRQAPSPGHCSAGRTSLSVTRARSTYVLQPLSNSFTRPHLLHDDVVDSSSRRRGQDSANTVFGNQASVLVGDFLYSRAFQMMVDIDSMRIMQILADATNTIAAGEVMQLMNVHDPDTE